MKPFTVILIRSEKFQGLPDAEPYGKDSYVAMVEADDISSAITTAKREAYDADEKDRQEDFEDAGITLDDYVFCLMFDGHITPCLYGWQER